VSARRSSQELVSRKKGVVSRLRTARKYFSWSWPRRGFSAIRYASAKKNAPQPKHDDALVQAFAPKEAEFKHISFTFAIISLSAKLAMCDGKLTRESYIVFRDAFPLSGGLCPKLRKLFVLACEDPTPMEHYVSQIKHVFPRNQLLFHALTARMFAIASAHPPISKQRERFLSKLAHMLEISPAAYSALYEQHTSAKPHHILGTDKRPSKQMLKKRYHALMQRYHPDRYAGEALSHDVAQLLSLRTAEIGAAYKALSRKAA
jgi:DnaJ like chaperone protein